MTMERRDFLKLSGTSASALALGAPLSLPLVHVGGSHRNSGRVLVVIYLRGGQDALNTVIPFKDDRYYEIRPTIAIARPGADKAEKGTTVIPLDKHFGLHPALSPLKQLWDDNMFVPILSVGSQHPTRSHFDAQDFMEYAAPGLRTMRNGWLNRFLTMTKSPQGKDPVLRALAMQGLLPRSLRGHYPVLAVPDIRRRGRGRNRRGADSTLDAFERLYGDNKADKKTDDQDQKGMAPRREDAVLDAGRATIRAMRRYQVITERPTKTADGVSYPRGGLGTKLARIARVIKSQEPLEIACADYNGWDHHANEGDAQGTMARMLDHLARSLAAFMKDLEEHAGRTLVLTMTEFGRTCRENGNRGTDHGHGGLMFAVGGRVRGGKVYGKWNGLADDNLYQGRDLQVTTDFRDVMAEVLKKYLEFDLPRDFFPDYRPGKGVKFLS